MRTRERCSLTGLIDDLNPVITGWRNYYRYATGPATSFRGWTGGWGSASRDGCARNTVKRCRAGCGSATPDAENCVGAKGRCVFAASEPEVQVAFRVVVPSYRTEGNRTPTESVWRGV